MVSVITPFYNSASFIGAAISSVLNQTYTNWELLLINDGSTDQSKEIVMSFNDSRIRYFEQENKGVAAARNLGLTHMKGDYFCFLDSDDIFPEDSLVSRLTVFKENPEVSFVDGTVIKFDHIMNQVEHQWHPDLHGNPLDDLVCLGGKSFFGPSWMVKIIPGVVYRLREGLTHGEDLLFYMNLARQGGIYAYTSKPVLHYRNNPESAMKNLQGLELGYKLIEREIEQWKDISKEAVQTYKWKYRRAMFLAYLKDASISNAFKVWFH